MIRQAGAREVHMRIASPPITGPCYYGIDTPTRKELTAANHSVEEIRQKLGVDTLGYLSLQGMLAAASPTEKGFCHACFSGQYPTIKPEPVKRDMHEPSRVPIVNASPVQTTQ
jgi:amidophosphoribosyltransferase